MRRAGRLLAGVVVLSSLAAVAAVGIPAAFQHTPAVPGGIEAPVTTAPAPVSGRVLAPAAAAAIPATVGPIAGKNISGPPISPALPFTGAGSAMLAVAGAAMVVLGALALVLGRHPLRHSRGH